MVGGYSERVVRACALFGLAPEDARVARPRVEEAARELDALLRVGEVALVTGPSGGGKSTLLRVLEARCGDAVVRAGARGPRAGGRVIDVVRGELREALGLLASAGLADATILPRRRGELSEGQRFRLSLALAMRGCVRVAEQRGRLPLLLIDEFGSTLDRTTACGIARTLRRWAGRAGARVVCATAHDDILEALTPAVLVHVPLGAAARVVRAPWADGLREEEAA